MRPAYGWLPSAPPLKLYRILYLLAAQAPGASIKAMISVAAMTAKALLTAVQNLFVCISPSRHIAWRVVMIRCGLGFLVAGER